MSNRKKWLANIFVIIRYMISTFFYVACKYKSKYVYKLMKLITNIMYPLKVIFFGVKGVDEDSDVIISLTSFPDRIDKVWITVSSLLDQTKKPKNVILWLSSEQFKYVKIPKKLAKLQKYGLIINMCDDLKSHKKYYYAFRDYTNKYIMTADDDIIYPECTLQELKDESDKYKNVVTCHWGHKISKISNDFLEYNNWSDICDNYPSVFTLPVGCCGVLYPPSCLSTEILNRDEIKRYIYTDDLWLKCIELREGVLAKCLNKIPFVFFDVIGSQNNGLWKSNTKKINRNDVVWKELMSNYPDSKEILMEGK